jgi:hypothetical protein
MVHAQVDPQVEGPFTQTEAMFLSAASCLTISADRQGRSSKSKHSTRVAQGIRSYLSAPIPSAGFDGAGRGSIENDDMVLRSCRMGYVRCDALMMVLRT